jgi:hypothetical protein
MINSIKSNTKLSSLCGIVRLATFPKVLNDFHLSRFSNGIPFGQKEKLVTRLKNIISAYPRDHSVLNELLQNADDAGATEIHFVLDSRHHRTIRRQVKMTFRHYS